MKKRAFLALEDGSCFYGHTECSDGFSCAEVIFNTAPFGYQEVCTDPSYANQFVVFTSSHIGNVGVNLEDYESEHIWVKGIIAREISKYTSSWRAQCSYIDFLKEHKTPWVEGIDTRKLTRHLQKTGSQNGCLVIGDVSSSFAIEKARSHVKAEGLDLLQVVIEKKRSDLDSENDCFNQLIKPLVCVLDFGIKNSILKKLKKENCAIKVFPGSVAVEKILNLEPNGIVLSNGPGDPSCSQELIHNIKRLINSKIPLLGICFGHQLLGLASGCRIKKMKFGHHGVNHPVYEIPSKKVYITSQNHNFILSIQDFPRDLEITHISLFDRSVQGFRSKKLPVIAFQGHPEGGPGPEDIDSIFKDFINLICVEYNSYANRQ